KAFFVTGNGLYRIDLKDFSIKKSKIPPDTVPIGTGPFPRIVFGSLFWETQRVCEKVNQLH
ncbi:MAG: hypothetical protein PVH19_10940, partial [Planctomycetia bacterium]